MSDKKPTPETHAGQKAEHDHRDEPRAHKDDFDISRRLFVGGSAAGIAAATAAGMALLPDDDAMAAGGKKPPKAKKGRLVLKNAIVLSLDPAVGDFDKADVVIEDGKIAAIGPNLGASGKSVDCTGLIVMPGFIETHHHQYETIMRSIIPDGLLQGNWPLESYGSVVQNIWTAGRIGTLPNPTWDLQRPPLDPEDVYLAELVAGLSQISQGITMVADTSQSSHTPAYTDAMIQGLMASGQRALYVYSAGTNRGAGYEYPGKLNDETVGIGRIAKAFFPSDDQLVTLGAATTGASVVSPDGTTQSYTGFQLARAFGAHINNHNVGSPSTVINIAADARNGTDWSDVTFVHCVRWQDQPLAQIGHTHNGYPNPSTSAAMQIWKDRGAHVSIATLIEAQMRHGFPPFQLCLNYGIMPSLSPDVDTNMTPEPFSLMRSAFTLQRGLANDLAFPLSNPGNLETPQLITARQAVQMMTIAGAAGNGALNKVGTLSIGKEADIVFLDTRNIDIAPMHNVPGTIVTMMNQRHVKHVMIAGEFKFWNYNLVGVKVDKLVTQLEQVRAKVLSRIQGPAPVGAIPPGLNSESGPYKPNRFGSCCFNGQNTTAPLYTLRP